MTPGKYDITIYKGTTVDADTLLFTWKDGDGDPINLTGYSARMQVRPTVQAVDTPLLELTNANGKLVLGGAAGTIAMALSAAATTAITWHNGVYDLELVSGGGIVTRLLEGAFRAVDEVTR